MEARFRIVAGLAMAIMAIGAATPLQAADSRLDDAHAHLVKARALVKAAEPSSAKKDYDQHAKRAESLIDQAMREIDLAKSAADAAPRVNLNRSPSMGAGVTPNPSGLTKLNPQPEPPSKGVGAMQSPSGMIQLNPQPEPPAPRAYQLDTACADYAALAVEQNRLNQQARCGLGGPRWSNDVNAHRTWCIATKAAAAASETAARQTALNGCSRNNRQLTATQFQNANQKATQYINMLSSIMKTLNESRKGTIKNMQ
jgi:hypothetical protein